MSFKATEWQSSERFGAVSCPLEQTMSGHATAMRNQSIAYRGTLSLRLATHSLSTVRNHTPTISPPYRNHFTTKIVTFPIYSTCWRRRWRCSSVPPGLR